MISFKHRGDFSKANAYLRKLSNFAVNPIDFNKYGQEGVAALSAATPVATGATANSWFYSIEQKPGKTSIVFHNTNIQNGVPIAIILQYGHGTGTGGWVQGRNYINPAIQPIFDRLLDAAWKEVTAL